MVTAQAQAQPQPFRLGFDPLKALSASERKATLDEYLRYLRRRDGEPNLKAHTLSHRDPFFAALDSTPVKWSGAVERDAFFQNLNRILPSDVAARLDRKTIWLLAAAKSNRAENYGVQLELSLKGEEYGVRGDDYSQHMTFIDLEEFYHTRILKDCCKLFGLEFDMIPPKSFTRWFTGLVVRSPLPMRLMTALCGELFGCVAFEVLWETADLFAEQNEVLERLRLLTREILVDEMGHVAFGNAMQGVAGLLATRAVFPAVANYFLHDLPEFAILAGGKKRFLERVAAFDLGQNRQLWDLSSVRTT